MAQNQNLPRTFQMEQCVLDNIKVFFPHVQITLHDLRNPTPELVSKIYGSFLEELGVNTANLLQIQNNQMTLIAHVDMYNVSVPVLNQYQCINFFLKHIGIDNFGITDLFTPLSKRTLFFFDALLKFLSYCDDRIASLQPEIDRIRELGFRRRELLSKIEVMRNDINHRATARTQRQDKIKELDKMIDAESQKLDIIMHEKQVQVSAVNSIKKLLEEDAEKENQLIQSIKKLEDGVVEWKGMIVKSPQKLIHLTDEQNQRKEELLQTVKNLKNQIEEKKRLTYTISEQQKKQDERFQKVKDLLDIKVSIRQKEKEKIDFLDQYEKMLERCDENKLRISGQQERRKLILENVEEHRQRKENQESEGKEFLQAAEKELKLLMNARKEKVEYWDEIQISVNRIIEDIEQIEEQFSVYKENEEVTRQILKSWVGNLIHKYEAIISKLQSINKNLRT